MKNVIIGWIRKKVSSCQASGVVLGLSGGIDSCVCAALAREALGKKRVLALWLPCHSQAYDAADARLVAKTYDIRTTTVDLTDTYDMLIRILPSADRLTRANVRPRLRMTVLYYFARKLNYLVCGTSNKTEIMAGYFTKFGDGASDIAPLGNLYKTQVRALAKELQMPVPIMRKPPTAGLWPGQTDEGEMGITYPELDEILSKLAAGKRPAAAAGNVRKVKRMVACSEHKRRPSDVFTLK
jgi:NAD+ synthase